MFIFKIKSHFYFQSKILQRIYAETPYLVVIFLESDLIWKLHGLRLYKLPCLGLAQFGWGSWMEQFHFRLKRSSHLRPMCKT